MLYLEPNDGCPEDEVGFKSQSRWNGSNGKIPSEQKENNKESV
jgi:hypothetical protein|tara:strand:- start:31 stop:159 length:129 start_codon:yes stop_codon:yes gene_type:complete